MFRTPLHWNEVRALWMVKNAQEGFYYIGVMHKELKYLEKVWSNHLKKAEKGKTEGL